MGKLFNDILADGIRKGQMPAKTTAAREWYRNKAKQQAKLNDRKFFLENKDKLQPKRFQHGSMYTFYYDAKLKDSLPYWDRLPLIFPFAKNKKGNILGINMHYLPLPLRAQLMDSLYEHTNNDKFDETTKLKMNYQMLMGISKHKLVAPTVHSYIPSHIRSKLMYIEPAEWDIALFLPTQKFVGATATQVWRDSRRKIRGK